MITTKSFLAGIAVVFFLAAITCTEDPAGLPAPIPDKPVTDIDNNTYQTVKIGEQVWTVENLRTKRYNNGDTIPLITDSAAWYMLTKPGYCYYKNTTNADTIRKFGALYNWYVVNPANPKKIAPAGWHVPTDSEWTILENYLIANGYNWDGTTANNKVAKSMAADTIWSPYPTAGTIGNDVIKNNLSGFSALPGGCRSGTGVLFSFGSDGFWWSATEFDVSNAHYCGLYYDWDYLDNYGNTGKSCGFSVRLVRN